MIAEFQGEYRWLSNFWLLKVPIVLDGLPCWSVEHAYQAEKTENKLHRRRIIQALYPGVAKRFGRVCPVRPGWDGMRLSVMELLVNQKFRLNPDLMLKLLETGDQELVEGNYWGDRFWGVSGGKGENHLGRIIMKVRYELSHAPTLLASE